MSGVINWEATRRRLFVVLSGIVGTISPSQAARVPSRVSPHGVRRILTSDEKNALMPGLVVFESNRGGKFGIYKANPDGTGVSALATGEHHCLYPCPSPDGRKIAFARTESLERGAQHEILLMNADGSGHETLVENGTFPSFDPTGTKLYFERDRRKTICLDLRTGVETEIFPACCPEFGDFEIAKPRVSDDGKKLYFISDKAGRWNVWGVNIETGEFFHVGQGCEPTTNADGSVVTWVKKRSFFGRTSLITRNYSTGEKEWLPETGPAGAFKYFPTLAPEHSLLFFSAGEGSEWTHTAARYQIYVKHLETGACWRITDDKYINRWPRFLPRAGSVQ